MAMPKLVSRVHQCRTLRDAGVVDEDIRVAESFTQVAEHAFDTFRIGDVTNERDRIITNLTSDLFNLFGSSSCNRDARAVTSERQGDGATNPSPTASYECCFAVQHIV
jgi:hypothetical protein